MVMVMEQKLLPGLPNDITLAKITTKVELESIGVLSNVNHTWNQAIRDQHVHNARVHCHSTETFDVTYCRPPFLELCCSDARKDDPRGFPYFRRDDDQTEFVVLDGKVYSLGVRIGTLTVERNALLKLASAEVYVLDLAGCSKHWKRCAPMQVARLDFVCGVKDGKMHVVGGWESGRHDTHIDTVEVYDPNKDAWSSMPFAEDWRTSDWWSDFRLAYSVDM